MAVRGPAQRQYMLSRYSTGLCWCLIEAVHRSLATLIQRSLNHDIRMRCSIPTNTPATLSAHDGGGLQVSSTTFRTVKGSWTNRYMGRYTSNTYKIGPDKLELVFRRRLIVTARTVSTFFRYEKKAHSRFSLNLGNVRHKVHVNGLDRRRSIREPAG